MKQLLILSCLMVSLIITPAFAGESGRGGKGKGLAEKQQAVNETVTGAAEGLTTAAEDSEDAALDVVEDVDAAAQEGMAKKDKMKSKVHKGMQEKQGELGDLEEETKETEKLKARKKEKLQNQQKQLKGLEKQKAKKAEQMQKELEKGSEQGQEARSQRKKWWIFGGGQE